MKGPTEEELIGSDDEALIEPGGEEKSSPLPVDGVALVRLWHRKAHTLATRLVRRLKLTQAAASSQSSEPLDHPSSSQLRPPTAIRHICAVLATLRQLCMLERQARWVLEGEILVPEEVRRTLFLEAARLLCAPLRGLVHQANEGPERATAEERSVLNGLTLWLARDCALDMRQPVVGSGREMEASLEFACLLLIAPRVAGDPVAERHLRESVLETAVSDGREDAAHWLEAHLAWGAVVGLVVDQPSRATLLRRELRPGDFAFPTRMKTPRLMVVLEVGGQKVALVDVEVQDQRRLFREDSVQGVMIAGMNGDIPVLMRPEVTWSTLIVPCATRARAA